MMNPTTNNVNSAVEIIKKIGGEKIGFIIQYGSTVTGEQTPLSDIDIAVYYHGTKKQRFDFIITVLGNVNDQFDIHIFQDLPLYIQQEVISKGKLLYQQDFSTTFDIFMRTIQRFSDFKPLLDIYYEGLEG
ncbi:MAG: nucleotidyltransferase domain-containing protein [Candidatus Thermoplasmatota archaeon]|nr:nucleotidyltransferase domain-containing protein [Candidatus Thermoplasmatota archaeon]